MPASARDMHLSLLIWTVLSEPLGVDLTVSSIFCNFAYRKVKRMKNRIIGFVWQHLLLLVSLFVMTFGVVLCVRSMLGSSVISVIPYVFESAGSCGLVPSLTIGQYTYLMNGILVVGQICVLRRQFEPVQLLQLVVGFIFGTFIDVNMLLTTWLAPAVLWQKVLVQVAGCTILGVGIALEVRCGSVTMPGEGFPVAISRVTSMEFPKAKICVDVSLVVLGLVAMFVFFGQWQWQIVGLGTLFAMFYVGYVVKRVGRHLGWFERLLAYRPGFRRYVYGLARYIYRKI